MVDDDEGFLEIASLTFKRRGFDTVPLDDGRSALERAENLQPDFILSDIIMAPHISGWEFALALRRNPKTVHIKIGFFTSLKDPWLELDVDRELISREIGDVVFFDKCQDIVLLAAGVADLLKK